VPSIYGSEPIPSSGLLDKLKSSAVYKPSAAPEKTDKQENEEDLSLKKSKGQSKASVGSASTRGHVLLSREISETFSTKIYEMKWCFAAIAINALLLFWIAELPKGMIVPIEPQYVAKVGGVIVEIILLIANVLALQAMDTGLQAYFGFILSSEGISMAVCGFCQTPSYSKWSYANELSLNSSVRKRLSKLSYMWLLVELLKLLTPFPATSLRARVVTADSGSSPCIEFNQDGAIVDRNWPNFQVEAGLAELIFGNSIGELRSQMDVNITRFIMGPQLIGAVNDGDTLAGNGYVTDILTSCLCSAGSNATFYERVHVNPSLSQQLSDLVNAVADDSRNLAIVHALENDGEEVNITAIMIHTPLCGGFDVPHFPVCKTVINNHRKAVIEVRYMTDGTPASIAQENSVVRSVGEKVSISKWLYPAFQNIFETDISVQYFPSTVPGMLAPLMYWTSPDLIAMDKAMIEGGLETYYVIMMRAAIQRSYGHDGTSCIRNAEVPGLASMTMSDYGVNVAIVALVLQLTASVLSVGFFVPWILSSSPASPAIRAVRDIIYFTTLLSDSNFSDHIRGLCNAPTYAIWQGLDITVRVGEGLDSVENEVGHITMDKPKLVRPLVNGRQYS
jgi:hypothetical protein